MSRSVGQDVTNSLGVRGGRDPIKSRRILEQEVGKELEMRMQSERKRKESNRQNMRA